MTSPVENVPVHAADVHQKPGAVQLALATGQVQGCPMLYLYKFCPFIQGQNFILVLFNHIRKQKFSKFLQFFCEMIEII